MKKEYKATMIAILLYLVPILYGLLYYFDYNDIYASIIIAAVIVVYGWYLLQHQLEEYESKSVKNVDGTLFRKVPRLFTLVVSGYTGGILLVVIAELPASESPTLINIIHNLVGLDAFIEPIKDGASPYVLNLVIGMGIGLFLKIGAGIDNGIWRAIDNYLK